MKQTISKKNPLISKLVEEVGKYLHPFDKQKLVEAFEFAREAHEGQMREENVPYITHPVETTSILSQLKVDQTTLMAALLHDVPEDTPRTIEEIEEKFGPDVGFLVEGITKLSKVYYRHNMQGRQVESLKKLLLHSAKDPRVVLIKLADRLHNMRTLDYLRADKRIRIAKETVEIYVPIANLLGLDKIKSELEDLCFKYLHPDQYAELRAKILSSQKKQQKVLEKMMKLVKQELSAQGIHATVSGRQKTLYGIFKKIRSQGKAIADVDDRIAMRIIVPTRDESYMVLGIIHALFKAKPTRFKDYIAVPKNNGYQSIHTTVFGIEGIVTEFQIRTHEMHLEDEYGIAAHFFYKEADHDFTQGKRSYTDWAQRILELQREQANDPHFIENLKIDVFQDRIFVFTPKGDVVDLPKDATGIDFAYAIHSHIGNHAVGMEINGESFPLSTAIPNGATIRIITSLKHKAPEQSWLNFAKTTQAKNAVHDFLKKQDRQEKIRRGYELLSLELARVSLDTIENLNFKHVNNALKEHSGKQFSDMENLLIAIGDSSLSSLAVIQSLYPNYDLKNIDERWLIKLISLLRRSTHKFANIWIKVTSKESLGQARKILSAISETETNIIKTVGKTYKQKNIFVMRILLEISSLEQLSKLCNAVQHVEGVYKVERIPYKRQIVFLIACFVTLGMWILHPVLVFYITKYDFQGEFISALTLYGGLFLPFLLIYMLRLLSQKSFVGQPYMRKLWQALFAVITMASLTVVAEVYLFKINLNEIFVFAVITGLYAIFTSEYLRYIGKYEV